MEMYTSRTAGNSPRSVAGGLSRAKTGVAAAAGAPVLQRMNVDFRSNKENFSLSASGRPGWAAKVTKKLKPKEGQSRGHIIEWNTRQRAHVNRLRALGTKSEVISALGLRKGAADEEIRQAIYDQQKDLYNDLGNLTINDSKADNEAGAQANILAQQIDQEEYEEGRLPLLKQLFQYSFNPGIDKKGMDKWDEYVKTFAEAWGLNEDEVKKWDYKQKGKTTGKEEEKKVVKGGLKRKLSKKLKEGAESSGGEDESSKSRGEVAEVFDMGLGEKESAEKESAETVAPKKRKSKKKRPKLTHVSVEPALKEESKKPDVEHRTKSQRKNQNRRKKKKLQQAQPGSDFVQLKKNRTGLPDQLKTGVEGLSGVSLDDVKVHYNSGKPSQLQASAYAHGTDIHIGPGQKRHLPHEAWHVVQQKQGRVRPTLQAKNVAINDDKSLEQEADVMGAKALRTWSGDGEVG